MDRLRKRIKFRFSSEISLPILFRFIARFYAISRRFRQRLSKRTMESSSSSTSSVLPELRFMSTFRRIRLSTFAIGVANVAVVSLAGVLTGSEIIAGCGFTDVFSHVFVVLVALMRVSWMIGAGIAQEATAVTILGHQLDECADEAVVRRERRMKYKRWLLWARVGVMITILQFCSAASLMIGTLRDFWYGRNPKCLRTQGAEEKWTLLIDLALVVLVWFLALAQICNGSDVLRWRSFYATQDNAWKAHYKEIFDHGIREVLCCLGRAKYLSVLEEDEVYSVAALLGDLVAYRASGTGHLELLAGLALMQRNVQSAVSHECQEAPKERLEMAVKLHQFAEAAYTGPLLDVGRNPVLFPCVWLYRQGILAPWNRHRIPVLEGDNRWRGHATAFLKYLSLPPHVLRRGRVSQARREAAYFVLVLHDLRSVVIAVRGTETPEDLLTDGLCRECVLSNEDLDGLINSKHIKADDRQHITSTFPHYGHSGIVASARELHMQLDGQPGLIGDSGLESDGFLSSLFGSGGECHGYGLQIVGHSLGGSVAAFLGIRLLGKFPDLRVYSYGTLPCVDPVIAEACSKFVTSIVYNDEFSARLSVCSILRLRAAAIGALAQDYPANSPIISKFVKSVLHSNNPHEAKVHETMDPCDSKNKPTEDCNSLYRRGKYMTGNEPDQEIIFEVEDDVAVTSFLDDTGAFDDNHTENQCDLLVQKFEPCLGNNIEVALNITSPPLFSTDAVEMFIPGCIIHIVPGNRKKFLQLWRGWSSSSCDDNYRTYIGRKEDFMDIVVSPYMFIDHLPWRCQYAMQRALETVKAHERLEADMLHDTSMV